MSLGAGACLGPYEVVALLGAGGMGEVYRARDTRLKRDVALKVLPPQFASDPERLARFQREAELLASLNHPGIAAIYGLEQDAGTTALVLELVDGDTLADRIAGGALPLDEALPIAKQIAEALEAAHEQGIIHRDLKPANIKLRPDGTVKVLDFGLAKLNDPNTPNGLNVQSTAPTITSRALMTGAGAFLGTAAYMSPEHARGKPADRRSDIWAFGCVLFEMLTGAQPFAADHVTDALALIVTADPAWAMLPASTPPMLHRLLRRCLQKDRKQRVADIADVRFELDDLSRQPAPTDRSGEGIRMPRRGALAAAAGVMATTAVVAAMLASRREVPLPALRNATRLTIPAPAGFQMWFGQIPSLAAAPDGSRIVFESGGRLYVRRLDGFDPEPIANTEGAYQPFFSADGEWLGFFASGQSAIMKVPVTGGLAVKIADVAAPLGLTWGPNGQIVFAAGIGNGGLWTVSADGGTPTQITKLAESAAETNHLWPDFLPDGSVLFTALGPSGHAQDAKLVVRDIAAATSTVVVEHATYGRYLAGHLIYTDGTGTLLLQPFDLANRRTTGPARAVLSGVRLSTWGGAVPYAVSRSGTLAYATGTEFSEGVLVELDHSGRELRRFGGPQSIEFVTLSPDGGTLAACVRSPTNDDIHLIDVGSGRSSRFTYDISEDESPVWSPDGRHIAYSAAAVGEQRRIVVKEIGGTQAERVLHTGKRHLHLTSWSADGWIAFDEFTQRSVDTWAVNVDDPSKLLPLGTSDENEEAVVFAPDGKSIAYHSDVTGRYEVYVKSFPALNPLQQVSGEGGLRPQWSDNGDTLTFFNRAFLAPVRMMRARRAGAARGMPWQETELFRVPSVSDYSVSGDGRRFYHVARNPDSPAPEIQVIVNWLAEVEAQPSSR